MARGAVNNAGLDGPDQAIPDRAFELQLAGSRLHLCRDLTMCPTGWFIPTADGPDYLEDR